MRVGIAGAGAFGTALAIALGRKGPVTLWSRSADQAARMAAERRNEARLPGADLPETVTPTANFADLANADVLLLAMPMQQMRAALAEHHAQLGNRPLVACCKGIELATGFGPTGVIAEAVPGAIAAILTGPSFAGEIARGLPTALTLACADPDHVQALQRALSTETLRLYRTTDTAGAELGGALKNVMAIACGAVIGAGLGNSARAALMTRGYAEMLRIAAARGARPETLAGLSGFGDLTLSCTSEMSRNYQLGLAIGRGETFDATVTVEGAATARAIAAAPAYRGIDLPITHAVASLVDGRETLPSIMAQLLARSLKEE
ncbi:NAD(P)H-dependent glycerol-3-phosphate dehydrogenase [Seohaeicola zhoushanensis]|uniref:Glycerol-3-phosphate dehydrogenase [NAD(P)+] n=1 Tax=Seohaeicola zhoushanensis TaxID=1569283 RepID=A0A8J3M3V8_9RHOB|nr:NAD(P)H-dependent glycerol-3-phosphate dehydrogenase [Seohaeicola zhoushanensis]GHF35477.1 glycerol-3-phosphate dehydrogenase [NAD(P)+] [Seohaeicola zhoushanensis]